MAQPATGTLRVTTLHGPGDLTPQTEEWLTAGLTAALPGLRMRSLFQARMDMFREADLITVTVDGETIVGVLSSRWCQLSLGPRFLHVTTQFVADTYRHGAVFRRSWYSHFADLLRDGSEFPSLIVLKTYNPIVYCAMRTFTAAPRTAIYPPISAAQDEALLATADEVARTVAPGRMFDRPTGVIRSAGSPADLYPEMPRSRDGTVNDYFATVLQPGDRILCLLSVPDQQGAQAILHAFGLA